MLTLEMAIDKIRQLPPEKQEQVFQFVESLDHKGEESEDFLAIAGIWENREITAETLRQEAWKE
ncbi:MAG: hypothetical protein RLZZ381_2487 [Cyanobacteriota bacterium]|jgi:hypothetical protein